MSDELEEEETHEPPDWVSTPTATELFAPLAAERNPAAPR